LDDKHRRRMGAISSKVLLAINCDCLKSRRSSGANGGEKTIRDKVRDLLAGRKIISGFSNSTIDEEQHFVEPYYEDNE